MAEKWHVNGEGNPGRCAASNRPCPFGGEEKHYSSEQQAKIAYERKMDSQTLIDSKKPNIESLRKETSKNKDASKDEDQETRLKEIDSIISIPAQKNLCLALKNGLNGGDRLANKLSDALIVGDRPAAAKILYDLKDYGSDSLLEDHNLDTAKINKFIKGLLG